MWKSFDPPRSDRENEALKAACLSAIAITVGELSNSVLRQAPSEYKEFKEFIEAVIDQLKTIWQIAHSRHRNPVNSFVRLMAGLVAYCHQPRKQSLNL